ncbi:Major Facilitator Superfamily protein [compost metagenome]
MGIGRLGAIVGPVLGGVLHGANLPYQTSFLAFAIPGAIGAAAILVFIRRQLTAKNIRGVQPIAG